MTPGNSDERNLEDLIYGDKEQQKEEDHISQMQ
jgi:hypothetical protein